MCRHSLLVDLGDGQLRGGQFTPIISKLRYRHTSYRTPMAMGQVCDGDDTFAVGTISVSLL